MGINRNVSYFFFNCNPLEEVIKIGMGNLFSSVGYEPGYIVGFIIPHTMHHHTTGCQPVKVPQTGESALSSV